MTGQLLSGARSTGQFSFPALPSLSQDVQCHQGCWLSKMRWQRLSRLLLKQAPVPQPVASPWSRCHTTMNSYKDTHSHPLLASVGTVTSRSPTGTPPQPWDTFPRAPRLAGQPWLQSSHCGLGGPEGPSPRGETLLCCSALTQGKSSMTFEQGPCSHWALGLFCSCSSTCPSVLVPSLQRTGRWTVYVFAFFPLPKAQKNWREIM